MDFVTSLKESHININSWIGSTQMTETLKDGKLATNLF